MQPTLQDFVKGIDFTGSPDVTGSALNQLVDAGYVAEDKGLIITTTDVATVPEVPDPTAGADEAKWKRYFWRRVGASFVTIYTWNDTAVLDATLLKWQSITISAIPPGSIVNSMLANNSVENRNIVSMEYTKLTGAPSFWYNIGSNAAGGDLTGTYPSPTIGSGVVTGAKIAGTTITGANIADTTIPITKLYPHTIGKYLPRTNAGATAVEWYRCYLAELETLGTAGQIPMVNGGATAVEWVSPTSAIIKTYTELFSPIATGAQVYTTSAHNLGGQPTSILVQLVNKANTAGLGFSVDDLMDINVVTNSGGGDAGAQNFAIWCPVGATTIKVIKRSGSVDMLKSDGTFASISDAELVADWNLRVTATRVQ